jgi:hypothetical protein
MSLNIAQINKGEGWLKNVNIHNFEQSALEVFRYQAEHCIIYRDYIAAIGCNPAGVSTIGNIPYLPISFFKSHEVTSGLFTAERIFESSGTTGMQTSRHYLKSAALYETSFQLTFERFYGKPEDYLFLCLLPSYLERGNSSLVYMADKLIRLSAHEDSGFYLDNFENLAAALQRAKDSGRKPFLLGVTFALLDFAAAFPMNLAGAIVMETGGMKGRREEWTRNQVHDFLKAQWQLKEVHSEYGMTELLSQAYALHDGIFHTPPFMKVCVRDENDPFSLSDRGSGCLNIIDLANIHSCSFIATDDIARMHAGGSFEVLGRLDHSALRGCSLMVV